MATSSITKNFIISGQKQVEMFVDAIENSANNRPVRTPVSARQIKGEAELRKFMEKGRKRMSVRNNYTMINIREYLALGTDEEVGEPALVRLLSDFHVQRTRMLNIFEEKCNRVYQKESVRYISGLSNNEGELIGYFSIALKPLTVRGETVSNTVKRKLLRISELDEKSQTYTMSAYLIAQLGKTLLMVETIELPEQRCWNWHGRLSKKCSIWVEEWWYSLRQIMTINC